jgi:hypothetical protein
MDEDEFVDDHKLNAGLVGTWRGSGSTEYGDWTDTYTIAAGTGSQIGSINHAEGSTWTDATIEYVYNFSETSGCLIVKYTIDNTDKYNAVYYKNLSSGSVLLGTAYDTTKNWEIESTDSSVNTLDEAKTRFAPANAATYGGGSAQTGTPQTKQP